MIITYTQKIAIRTGNEYISNVLFISLSKNDIGVLNNQSII